MSTSTPSRIRIIRTALGLAQVDVARACGISQAALSAVETGRKRPSEELLRRLSQRLGCPPAAFLAGSIELRVGRTTIPLPHDENPAGGPGLATATPEAGRHEPA